MVHADGGLRRQCRGQPPRCCSQGLGKPSPYAPNKAAQVGGCAARRAIRPTSARHVREQRMQSHTYFSVRFSIVHALLQEL